MAKVPEVLFKPSSPPRSVEACKAPLKDQGPESYNLGSLSYIHSRFNCTLGCKSVLCVKYHFKSFRDKQLDITHQRL